MTDRELLELAAKAVGIEGVWIEDDWIVGIAARVFNSSDFPWNPLINNGDAFMLAVKLRLHVSVFADAIGIGTPGAGYVEDKWSDDPYAATRLAIVKAAAQIGRAMK